ncbi:glucose-1-phosphatase-like [Cydia strobilella]|uniref:glucose-1-phosphatase-like n=1 Tax=Cydia strobilella TaxID=1100964 RepID=UPI003006B763
MYLKLLYIIPLLNTVVSSHGLKLQQVIALSRHNIRTPTNSNVTLYSPKTWPTFNEEAGYLTAKGSVLEKAMGKYVYDWLIEEKLLQTNSFEDDVFVYANNVERTIETAKAFVEGAGFGVDVYYKNTTDADPVFEIVLKTDTEEFIQEVTSAMEIKLNSFNLTDAYLELNKIVDLENSAACEYYSICDLSTLESGVSVIDGKLTTKGGIRYGFLFLDHFLMEYYDGKPLDEVAWGEIRTPKQWKKLTAVSEASKDVRYRTKPSDKDMSSTLLEYMTDVFKNGSRKFYLLVAHDTNISLLLSSLNFKNYTLNDQYEKEPIGGKVLFEKWYDEVYGRELLRVRYVYQSSTQIRDGVEASITNPPLEALLQMEGCAFDANGFCLWDEFITVLNNV